MDEPTIEPTTGRGTRGPLIADAARSLWRALSRSLPGLTFEIIGGRVSPTSRAIKVTFRPPSSPRLQASVPHVSGL
jgi:hypothetical protein